MSGSLSASNGRGESNWRTLTLRGIHARGGPDLTSQQVKYMVQNILRTLKPLTSPSQSTELESTLIGIMKDAVTIWKSAQMDQTKIVVETRPDPSAPEQWHADDLKITEETHERQDGDTQPEDSPCLCIVPKIFRKFSSDNIMIVREGVALFPNSTAWMRGRLEQKEHDEEVVKAVTAARARVHARRTAGPPGSTSPTASKTSKRMD